MKRALVVGIDHYEHLNHLAGCVNDATGVQAVLARNGDGSLNFEVRLLVSSGGPISRRALRAAISELFSGDPDVALFYFAGHGHVEDGGGYICGSDTEEGTDGLLLSEVMNLANPSRAKNKVIILDSCYGGIAGNRAGANQAAEITDGMTVLTASAEDELAAEENEQGLFTTLFVDALNGAAANLVGEITPGAIYAHIDQSLGSWGQRPVFKTNIKRFVSLRTVAPPLDTAELRQLALFFPTPDHRFALDPTYEPERSKEQRDDPSFGDPIPEHVRIFRILQNYARVNLVRPVDAPHMYHAAMESKACELTPLGRHYRQLVAKERI
jgi:hypothetical protein